MNEIIGVPSHTLSSLTLAHEIILRLGRLVESAALMPALTRLVYTHTQAKRVCVLMSDPDYTGLVYAASAPDEADETVTRWYVRTSGAERDPIIDRWAQGEYVRLERAQRDPTVSFGWLLHTLDCDSVDTLPLTQDGFVYGVLLLDGMSDDARLTLPAVLPVLSIIVANALQHSKVIDQLAEQMRELTTLHQIDRELNDTILTDNVFTLTVDWAMRYTGSHAASLALVEDDDSSLRYILDLGYEKTPEQIAFLRVEHGSSIIHRVARSGQAQVIPDVSMEKDYLALSSRTRAVMCVPIMREDRVVAVIKLDHRKLNAFTDAHLNFIEKLAARAGVAIDNARLFAATEHEREKLALILSSITDAVIVVTHDSRILLINASAIAALRLYTDEHYIGRSFADVVDHTPLAALFRETERVGTNLLDEVALYDERVFHVSMTRYEALGWIITLHDLSPLRVVDSFKGELVATVSHDLKQPLSAMNGYSELLLMSPALDVRSTGYIHMIQRSIESMRALIDDVLDLARIEAGVQLEFAPVHITNVVSDCLEALRQEVEGKQMQVINTLSEGLPFLWGDRGGLSQVFANLLSNAIKYTPPEGHVRLYAEQIGSSLRIAVEDDGLGISPEDQVRIFERFYRVRRPETDSIDGTGLGLTIVKRLVDMHRGHIGIESRLGEGTIFYVTLPVFEPDKV